jgi:hypothetical protein
MGRRSNILASFLAVHRLVGVNHMARAFVGGKECRVTVDRDLGETWAVAVLPPPVSGTPSAPLVVKLQGNDREAALKGALEILQRAGSIDSFEL